MKLDFTHIAAVGALSLAGGLLLAGCSVTPSGPTRAAAGTPSSSSPPSVAAAGGAAGAGGSCRLATVSDVTTVMGQAMTQSGGTAADCIYAAPTDPGQQLLVHEFLDQTNMSNFVNQLEPGSEHVDGLGDDAFWNGTIDTVFVRTGSRGFTITSTSLGAKTPNDPDAAKAAMVNLATMALSNF